MIKVFKYAFAILYLYIGPSDVIGQNSNLKTLNEVIDFHLQNLKKNLDYYDNIYVVLDFDQDFFEGRKKIYNVLSSLEPKFLTKKESNFLVKFVLKDENVIEAINFRITKKSNKKLFLANLSNGGIYTLE